MINKFDPLFINSCFTPYLQYFNHVMVAEEKNPQTLHVFLFTENY